ncbi:unnamed protein product [Heligmosomoides polygyrus]|uniref:NR LBD domain-containing protein n=1 Tax=Heligmosomoides polygyrus TaxID=6339 RepID=A0A183GNW7_HELPZ|nr:unnamed protein product [Heligmosomoides polygyrus]
MLPRPVSLNRQEVILQKVLLTAARAERLLAPGLPSAIVLKGNALLGQIPDSSICLLLRFSGTKSVPLLVRRSSEVKRGNALYRSSSC